MILGPGNLFAEDLKVNETGELCTKPDHKELRSWELCTGLDHKESRSQELCTRLDHKELRSPELCTKPDHIVCRSQYMCAASVIMLRACFGRIDLGVPEMKTARSILHS